VLVLANVVVMSDRAAEVVRRFVKNGGGLIASYETGLYDPSFTRRSDFVLGDLFRAKYVTSHQVNSDENGVPDAGLQAPDHRTTR